MVHDADRCDADVGHASDEQALTVAVGFCRDWVPLRGDPFVKHVVEPKPVFPLAAALFGPVLDRFCSIIGLVAALETELFIGLRR